MAPEPATKAKSSGQLPPLAAGPVEIGRLIRELEAIEDSLEQLSLRHGGTDITMPKTGTLLNQTAELNQLNLLHATDRHQLRQFLLLVKARAPLMHISFSAEPTPIFTEKLMTWLRREIHPLVLLTVGLQPNIGAGCVVRTANKQFDFSLRQDFANKRELLKVALGLTPESKA